MKTILAILSLPFILIGVVSGFVIINVKAGYFYAEDKMVKARDKDRKLAESKETFAE